jgi:hypothetical protein
MDFSRRPDISYASTHTAANDLFSLVAHTQTQAFVNGEISLFNCSQSIDDNGRGAVNKSSRSRSRLKLYDRVPGSRPPPAVRSFLGPWSTCQTAATDRPPIGRQTATHVRRTRCPQSVCNGAQHVTIDAAQQRRPVEGSSSSPTSSAWKLLLLLPPPQKRRMQYMMTNGASCRQSTDGRSLHHAHAVVAVVCRRILERLPPGARVLAARWRR